MNGTRAVLILVLAALLLAPLAGSAVLAQSSANYRIGWYVISGGNGQSSSASFAVHGTAGQTISGASPPSSASYAIRGGYWGGNDPLPYKIYLPLASKY